MALRKFVTWAKDRVTEPWMPFLVSFLSFVNTFILVLSAPLTPIFLACCYVRGSPGFLKVVILNALGSMFGCWVLFALLRRNGESYLRESFPDLFESEKWTLCEYLLQEYGFFGCTLYSAMPIVLHPLVLLGALARMDSTLLLLTIFIGRCVKYSLMGSFAVGAARAYRGDLSSDCPSFSSSTVQKKKAL